MKAVPYAIGAVLAVAIALILWALTNEHDTFMAECLPRASVEHCQEAWRAREAKP